MPFEFDPRLTKVVNHNHYPRTALIEAIRRGGGEPYTAERDNPLTAAAVISLAHFR